MSVDQDQIARAIREVFGAKRRAGVTTSNAAGSLNEIAIQLARIADALERLVEIELLDELDDDDDEDEDDEEDEDEEEQSARK
jgi:hypothetical protein